MTALTIPSEYGYVCINEQLIDIVNEHLLTPFIEIQVLGVSVASALYVFSLGAKVGGARKAAKVPYPYGKFFKH